MKRQPFLDGRPMQIVFMAILILTYIASRSFHAKDVTVTSLLSMMGAYEVGYCMSSLAFWIFKGKWL